MESFAVIALDNLSNWHEIYIYAAEIYIYAAGIYM